MRRSRAGHVCVCVLFFVVVFFFPPFYNQYIVERKKRKQQQQLYPRKKKEKKKKIQGERGYAWLVCSRHTVLRTSLSGDFWSLRRTDENEDY